MLVGRFRVWQQIATALHPTLRTHTPLNTCNVSVIIRIRISHNTLVVTAGDGQRGGGGRRAVLRSQRGRAGGW